MYNQRPKDADCTSEYSDFKRSPLKITVMDIDSIVQLDYHSSLGRMVIQLMNDLIFHAFSYTK